MDYIEISIPVVDIATREILLAQLSELGFTGFEEEEEVIKAFIASGDFNEVDMQGVTDKLKVNYSKSIIKEQNWNKLWESNFDPVVVDDFVGVRAEFHLPLCGVEHEIVITPKMSFGTGHHATTFMMMQLMRDIDFKGHSVFDFGTGTGILAILAEKLGAERVVAVDNDDWCIENAAENSERNHCKNIKLVKADSAQNGEKFSIILANINKNIILDNIAFLANNISTQGKILLSGLLQEDENDILEALVPYGWKKRKTVVKGIWIALFFEAGD
jgi:ribosomal protein L11 methyltransferase